MKIAVRTGGLLGKYLPEGSARNSAELEVPEGASARDVLERLGRPSDGGYLVIHNGVAVPKGARGLPPERGRRARHHAAAQGRLRRGFVVHNAWP